MTTGPASGASPWPAAAFAGGQVVGASDAHAAYPVDRPVTPQDVLASIYHSLGIDAGHYLARRNGEPFALVERGQPIPELFA